LNKSEKYKKDEIRYNAHMAKQYGIIETWKPSESFGFIQPDEGGKDCFFHLSEVASSKKPAVGKRVSYSVGRDAKGRYRAENIQIEGDASLIETVKGQTKGRIGLPGIPGGVNFSKIGSTRLLLFALPFFLTLVSLAWLPFALYFVASLIGFVSITLDKRFAQEKMWRIPEATLHLIEILGGWPGSGLAQQIMRHKTQKGSYQITFWVIAAVHLIIAADLFFFDLQLSQMFADVFA
jgi:uncharacterized membrane protein YsdA (DUF1294 family)/cold shock CspA family protein